MNHTAARVEIYDTCAMIDSWISSLDASTNNTENEKEKKNSISISKVYDFIVVALIKSFTNEQSQ